MVKKEVDARGLSCPIPLIQTKKALKEMDEGIVCAVVDNEVAKDNIRKFAKSMDYSFSVAEADGEFVIEIAKGDNDQAEDAPGEERELAPKSDFVVLISKETMGEGPEELGRILMRGYLYTLTEVAPSPKAVVFVNSGVKLACVGSESLGNLHKLEGQGVEIISCGTCLDYFKLKNNLAAGSVSNMYTIVEYLNRSNNTITI